MKLYLNLIRVYYNTAKYKGFANYNGCMKTPTNEILIIKIGILGRYKNQWISKQCKSNNQFMW